MSLLSPNLQAFLAVHARKTVMGAAEDLGLSQTGVTQRIRGLERELGVTLFSRSRMGMALTREGSILLSHCLAVREAEARVFANLKDGGAVADADVYFAGPTSFISGRAINATLPLFKAWPRLNLNFVVDDSERRLELLKTGGADLVVLRPHQVPAELDSKKLKPDEYCLVGHPRFKGRSMEQLLAEEHLYAFHPNDDTSLNYLRTFGLLGKLQRTRLYVNENAALQQLLCAGIGFGLLHTCIAAPLLASNALIALNDGKVMKDPLALAWYPRAEMPRYFHAIIESLK